MFLRLMTLAMLTLTQMCVYGADALAKDYTHQIIKVDPQDGGKAVALNNNGMVLGNFGGAEGKPSGVFTWQAGKVTKYRRPYIQGYGLNDAGDFVGSYTNIKLDYRFGFVYSNGKYTNMEYPGTRSSVATGINNSGTVVGIYVCGLNPESYCGFEYSAGTYKSFVNQQITGINQEGDMIAQFMVSPIPISNPELIMANGDTYSIGYGQPGIAAGLNSSATVIGEFTGNGAAFEYQGGGAIAKYGYFASPICGRNTQLTGINDAGDIVGACRDGTAPFVYHHGVFENLETVRGQVLQPVAINNRGQILANTAGGFSVLATPK